MSEIPEHEAHRRLREALDVLGVEDAKDTAADTALKTARRVLTFLLFGLEKAMNREPKQPHDQR